MNRATLREALLTAFAEQDGTAIAEGVMAIGVQSAAALAVNAP